MADRFGRKYMKDEDFEEEDVWGMMEERENSSPKLRKPNMKIKGTTTSALRAHFPPATAAAAPRMIPKSSSSSSTNSSIEPSRKQQQFSAPLDIPDWSKIYGKTSSSSWVNGYYVNGGGDHDHDHHQEVLGCNHCDYDYDGDGCDDGDDDDDDGMVPPHEFLARKLARTQISSFSVYEGIGRTLKGRDLSKLRNAILTKTGFLE